MLRTSNLSCRAVVLRAVFQVFAIVNALVTVEVINDLARNCSAQARLVQTDIADRVAIPRLNEVFDCKQPITFSRDTSGVLLLIDPLKLRPVAHLAIVKSPKSNEFPVDEIVTY